MKKEFRVLEGTAEEIENELNYLIQKNANVCVIGISATNEITTVIVEIYT